MSYNISEVRNLEISNAEVMASLDEAIEDIKNPLKAASSYEELEKLLDE